MSALDLARDYEFSEAISMIESRLRRRDPRWRIAVVTAVGDFVLERRVENDRLRAAIAEAFGLEPSAVAIATRVEDFEPSPINVAVYPVRGDYEQLVSVFVARENQPLDPFEALIGISRALGTQMLVPCDTPDPYVMWMILPTGVWFEVSVEDWGEDDAPLYRVDGAEPLPGWMAFEDFPG